MPLAATSRKRSSVSHKTDAISPTARESLFGLIPARKSTGSQGLSERLAGKIWKARKSVAPTARGYYACFFEDPAGNKLEICCRENPVVAGLQDTQPGLAIDLKRVAAFLFVPVQELHR